MTLISRITPSRLGLIAAFSLLVMLLLCATWFLAQLYSNYDALLKAETSRRETMNIAQHLRQTSDDLTRMARTYVATGNPRYRKHFDDILAIRDGKKPRPFDYDAIFWDLYVENDQIPIVTGDKLPLIDALTRSGISQNEMHLLTDAKNNSDELVQLERQAFAAMEGLFQDENGQYTKEGEPDQPLAMALLHGAKYHRAKKNIMYPIKAFSDLLEVRTAHEVDSLIEEIAFDRNIVILLTFMMIIYCTIIYFPLEKIRKENSKRDAFENQLRASVKELSLINHQKDKLFSIIAHDLKGPFTGLLNYSELFLKDLSSLKHKDHHTIATSLHHSTQQTYKLIENLLDWARLNMGQMEYNPSRLDINEMIATTLELYHKEIETKKITVHQYHYQDYMAYGDHHMIETIIRNFVHNAVKFSNIGGEITIRTLQKDSNHILLSVTDSAAGMTEETIKSLFVLGAKTTADGTAGESGTGLGLCLCKELIELNSGEIKVESILGQGSTFSVSIPFYK